MTLSPSGQLEFRYVEYTPERIQDLTSDFSRNAFPTTIGIITDQNNRLLTLDEKTLQHNDNKIALMPEAGIDTPHTLEHILEAVPNRFGLRGSQGQLLGNMAFLASGGYYQKSGQRPRLYIPVLYSGVNMKDLKLPQGLSGAQKVWRTSAELFELYRNEDNRLHKRGIQRRQIARAALSAYNNVR